MVALIPMTPDDPLERELVETSAQLTSAEAKALNARRLLSAALAARDDYARDGDDMAEMAQLEEQVSRTRAAWCAALEALNRADAQESAAFHAYFVEGAP